MGLVKQMIKTLVELSPDWLRPGVINMKLVDDETIQAFNKDYSGNDYATDVLSFSYIEGAALEKDSNPEVEPRELGDMLISLETAERQADEAGIKLAEEIATLCLHGILHIYGFDHANLSERRVMDSWQADILKRSQIRYRDFNWVSGA